MSHFKFSARSIASGAIARAAKAMKAVLAFVVLGMAICEPAMATLPAAVAPAGGAAAGDYMGLLQQYWKSGIAVLVLMIGAYAFVQTAGGAIEKFGQWRAGRAELTELKTFFFIGVVMLVTVVYLLTTANSIL